MSAVAAGATVSRRNRASCRPGSAVESGLMSTAPSRIASMSPSVAKRAFSIAPSAFSPAFAVTAAISIIWSSARKFCLRTGRRRKIQIPVEVERASCAARKSFSAVWRRVFACALCASDVRSSGPCCRKLSKPAFARKSAVWAKRSRSPLLPPMPSTMQTARKAQTRLFRWEVQRNLVFFVFCCSSFCCSSCSCPCCKGSGGEDEGADEGKEAAEAAPGIVTQEKCMGFSLGSRSFFLLFMEQNT